MAFERKSPSLISLSSHIFMKNLAIYPREDVDCIKCFPSHMKNVFVKKFFCSRAYTKNIDWKYFLQFFVHDKLLDADLTLYDVDDEVMTILQVCKGLEILYIEKKKDETGIITSDVLLSSVPNFSELIDLKILNCDAVTDDVVVAIVNSCPKLRKLSLNACRNVADVGLDAICTLQSLIGLDLSGTQITTDGLRRAADTEFAKRIEDLRFKNCQHVNQNVVTLIILAKCPALVNICLSTLRMQPGDNMNSWSHADNLKHLKQINWTIEW